MTTILLSTKQLHNDYEIDGARERASGHGGRMDKVVQVHHSVASSSVRGVSSFPRRKAMVAVVIYHGDKIIDCECKVK